MDHERDSRDDINRLWQEHFDAEHYPSTIRYNPETRMYFFHCNLTKD